ncbi:hypothetical protein [Brevibacillus nitrificans]|uniref:hypothetical protein n=1 Tax=Brevibacillus nitrificans TaxID=651560 RepID=UPI002859BE8A|nr:hypothetical protein [Brevibacillus nitrificans]MDR7314197.1 TyrR family helix-turn-helix protein [Brevibacillus nitrificans]
MPASNCNLEESVKGGKFRSYLFYRLNVLPVVIPALRERREDIFPLLYSHLEKFNAWHKRKRTFSTQAVEALQNYRWPGNIRELENVVEQLVILAAEDTIPLSDLPKHILADTQTDEYLYAIPADSSLTAIVEGVEKRAIELAYRQHKSTRRAARFLGITHSMLVRRLAKYHIQKEPDAE